MSLSTAITLLAVLSPTFYKTEASLQKAFSKALETSDGALFMTTMRAAEAKGVTDQQSQKFLNTVVKPWLSSKSYIALEEGGDPLTWNHKGSPFMLSFKPKGGMDIEILDNKPHLFNTPTLKESGGFKSTVGFAQIIFAFADAQAKSENRGKDDYAAAQKLAEKWIALTASIGIKGSVDPETGKFNTWAEIIKASRGEVDKL